MGISVYPLVTLIDSTTPVSVRDKEAERNSENLYETSERINKQLAQITELELEEGDI